MVYYLQNKLLKEIFMNYIKKPDVDLKWIASTSPLKIFLLFLDVNFKTVLCPMISFWINMLLINEQKNSTSKWKDFRHYSKCGHDI